jgi:hypothetical protein
MQKFSFILAAFGLSVALSACSRPAAEPEPIYVEPVYDKYGAVVDGGGCVGGQATAGTAAANDCLPPPTFDRQPQPDGGGSSTTGGGQPSTAPRG